MAAVMTAMGGLMKAAFSQPSPFGAAMPLGAALPFCGSMSPSGAGPTPEQTLQNAAQLLQASAVLLQHLGGKPGAARPTSTALTGAAPAPKHPPSGVPGAPDVPPGRNDKPTGNHTVADYVNANNGLLGKLGNQEGVKDKLKERYGDWDDPNRSEAERKQSAYNAARHVGMCKNKKAHDGSDRGDVPKNGKMEGATDSGQIHPGTEMAALKDSLKGSGAEQDKNTRDILGNPNLAYTKNKHVRKDGTTKSNAKMIASEAGKALFFIPGLSNVLKGIGDSEGGLGGAIKGGFGGVFKTWKNNAEGVGNAIMTGQVNPSALLCEMYKANIAGNEQSPEWAKTMANVL
ncbi:hypothetical protein M8A51_18470 [Schlegelella sp. S2-27]|uniref:Uncharacterized protein n=1 Tax=Caldimonas mangrovi TaxID=2944811 RepID=A0ABT0YS14_9BURK|nr:hypothetical protein [Caldimonas mangrovi]MCM5681516.1 hypothetical protein [Caldimonas mangrovi]